MSKFAWSRRTLVLRYTAIALFCAIVLVLVLGLSGFSVPISSEVYAAMFLAAVLLAAAHAMSCVEDFVSRSYRKRQRDVAGVVSGR